MAGEKDQSTGIMADYRQQKLKEHLVEPAVSATLHWITLILLLLLTAAMGKEQIEVQGTEVTFLPPVHQPVPGLPKAGSYGKCDIPTFGPPALKVDPPESSTDDTDPDMAEDIVEPEPDLVDPFDSSYAINRNLGLIYL
jgi:hypothetical protein